MEKLAVGPLVADGAMGTMLLSQGAPTGSCLEALNLQAPERVRRVHEAYRRAGAQILKTNTFGANAVRLGRYGLEGQVMELNAAAVKIAQEAAGKDLWIAGSVGPLGIRLTGQGVTNTAPVPAREVFRAQIAALVDAGADMILLETFSDPAELRTAVEAAREAAGECVLVAAQITQNAKGSLRNRFFPEAAAREAVKAGADLVGLNCCDGPESVWAPLRRITAEGIAPVIVQPSAGVPGLKGRAQIRLCSAPEFGEWAVRFFGVGASIVGGCCGTTPEHIRRVREAHNRSRSKGPPGTLVSEV